MSYHLIKDGKPPERVGGPYSSVAAARSALIKATVISNRDDVYYGIENDEGNGRNGLTQDGEASHIIEKIKAA